MSDIETLWRRYGRNPTEKLRNRIIEHYMYLVPKTALSMGLKQGTPVFEEYESHGYLALINSVMQFDPEKKVPFEPYAVQRIKWGMADGARSYDHIPKRVRHKMSELEDSYSHLRETLNKWPTPAEVAEFMGITPDELNSISALIDYDHTYTAHSNGASVDGEETVTVENSWVGSLIEGVPSHWWNPEEEYDVAELSQRVVDSMTDLTETEKQFVYCYYIKDLTLKATAKELGCREVSSIKTEALHKMRALYWSIDFTPFLS